MAVDQPQSTAERMAQNVAQLAQQRREEQALAQQQAELQQAEIDEIYSDTLDDEAEEADNKRLNNLIKAAQAAKGSVATEEPKPEPTAGEKIESSLTSLGSFIPSIKIPSKEDREARRAHNQGRRRHMAELAGKTSLSAGAALRALGTVDARDKDSNFKGPKLTDQGPSGGKGMTMTENPGRKQVAK